MYFSPIGERNANFVVGVTNTDPNTVAPTPDGLTLCAQYPGTSATGDIIDLTCESPVTGQYLVVQLRGTNFLSLCEVQVSGTPKGTCTF